MNIYNELPTAFPWYDRIEKQNRFRENVKGKTDAFGLISPRNAMLPFEFCKDIAAGIDFWHVCKPDGVIVATVDPSGFTFIRNVTRQGREYYYYNGASLGLDLEPGIYYGQITFSDGQTFYSEFIQVPECSFLNTDNPEFLKLVWYNDTDLPPIFYNDFDAGEPYFKNVVYLDSFVHESEPEIFTDGEKDGNNEVVPTFQKCFISYRITELVPPYLKNALVIMEMHDHVFLTTRKGVRTGEIEKLTTNTATEYFGAFSTVDIIFEEDKAMIKKGCGENMA